MRVAGDRFEDLLLVDLLSSDATGTWWICREGEVTRGLWLPSSPREMPDVPHPAVLPILRRVDHQGQPGVVYGVGAGLSLHDVLRKSRVDRGTARRWASTLASVLHAAHTHGVVHGAFSGRRIRVVGNDLLVWGFGGGPDPLVPDPGGTGTPSPASDVHAWGALVYELVTGVAPFPLDPEQRAAHAATGAHQPVGMVCPELPRSVAVTLYAALSPAPSSRPALPVVFDEPWPDTDATSRPASPPTIVAFDRSLSESENPSLQGPSPVARLAPPPAPTTPRKPAEPSAHPSTEAEPDLFPPVWLPRLAAAATASAVLLAVLLVLAVSFGLV